MCEIPILIRYKIKYNTTYINPGKALEKYICQQSISGRGKTSYRFELTDATVSSKPVVFIILWNYESGCQIGKRNTEYGILRIWLAIVADSDYNKRL